MKIRGVRNTVSAVMNREIVMLSGHALQARAYVVLHCKKDVCYFRNKTHLVFQALLSLYVAQFTEDKCTRAYTRLLSVLC